MENYTVFREKQVLFAGIDVHGRTYHMTGVREDGREELQDSDMWDSPHLNFLAATGFVWAE